MLQYVQNTYWCTLTAQLSHFFPVVDTQTLSHQTLYSRIVNHLVESYGNFVTIPLHWKRMFQKLDVLDSAHTLDPDVFDYVGSFSLLSHSLIRQCTCIISERCLPLEYVMERSSIDNSLLVESPELSALPRATASGPPLFSCRPPSATNVQNWRQVIGSRYVSYCVQVLRSTARSKRHVSYIKLLQKLAQR